MKIIIDGYEVEINAKSTGKKQYNKSDTMYLLNMLSILAREAYHSYDYTGCTNFAHKARDVADKIYKLLDENGLYK